ncbi:hypothetical protein IW146_007922 [Coemansia sp. RSA 922]|nr:hypothetical protein H4S03_000120 [Coemansia sp. S3946]KAJ2106137.1 hypothetical protein IW146_007922 [Coemansia sp. RSA 922]
MAKGIKEPTDDDDYIDIDDTGPGDLKGADGGYAWEEEYKRSWDVIQEDASGSIQSIVLGINDQQRRRRVRDTEAIQRGIIRHVVLIIDQSENMNLRDLMPTRIQCALSTVGMFIGEYFDQNPISQLSVIATKDGLAEKLTDLSGNPMDHLNALKDKANKDLAGEPSLQNALELAMHTLRRAPSHGSREIVCVMGSLTTCDPGDIAQTLEALKHAQVRVSMVHLAAEVHVFKKICKETGGLFYVAQNEDNMKDLLFENVPPPPVVSARATADMIQMGFPIKAGGVPTPCVCHHELGFVGYICPRCKSKVCSLPTDCDVCGLPLVSAPHLARSYHHLFPEENFKEVGGDSVDTTCFGCGAVWADPLLPAADAEGRGKYRCPRCKHDYCLECDIFIHETLHNCPGCV